MRRSSTSRIHSLASCLALAMTALAGAAPARAANDAGAPGAFLRFASSARTMGLGNAVMGLADDAAASYWNPAGLAQLRTMEITAMGATLFEDTQYSFFAFGVPTQSAGSFAVSGTFARSGGFERATLLEDLSETFTESEGVFALSYARGNGRMGYGATLKSASQRLGEAKGSGVGADLGLYLRPLRSVSLGFAVQNALAPEITLDQQPERLARSLRAGTALRFFGNRLLLLSDLTKTERMDVDFQSGVEVWPSRSLGLRGGYDTVGAQLCFGAGFRWENWQLDYAFVNQELGAVNVLSATLRFGVPYGVKVHRDRALFSPSGDERDVTFDIKTAVRGRVESWRLEIRDHRGELVKTVSGNGPPPGGVTWTGDDDKGRLVGDGNYIATVTILDDLGEAWDYTSSVEVLGFRDRTRVPIKIDVSGADQDAAGGKQQ
jgi:hypothetical protein